MVVPKHHSKAHSSTLPMKSKEKVKPTCFQRMLIIKHHGLNVDMTSQHSSSVNSLSRIYFTRSEMQQRQNYELGISDAA